MGIQTPDFMVMEVNFERISLLTTFLFVLILLLTLSGCSDTTAPTTPPQAFQRTTSVTPLPTTQIKIVQYEKDIQVVEKGEIVISFPNSNGPAATAILGRFVDTSDGHRYNVDESIYDKLEKKGYYTVIIEDRGNSSYITKILQ